MEAEAAAAEQRYLTACCKLTFFYLCETGHRTNWKTRFAGTYSAGNYQCPLVVTSSSEKCTYNIGWTIGAQKLF